MKKTVFILTIIAYSQIAYSQVPKKVVVEHFTNTKCSACAARNPGFYSNYSAQTNVIHLAVHPSSPYSACVLSQHNVLENDARTNYYGIYGGTPRLVIQGVAIPVGANYSSPSIFTPYLAAQSPANIRIIQSKYANDSIRSQIIIKTEATHSLSALQLFVALAEDTLNYTGSNGEPVHYDVFRKSLTGASGINVTLPSTIGDSVVYTMSSPSNIDWNFSRIFTLAILQETMSKSVVQSQSVPARANNIPTAISEINTIASSIKVYVSNKTVHVKTDGPVQNLNLNIYDLSGRTISTKTISALAEQINVDRLNTGIYFYDLKINDMQIKSGKLLIE